MILDKKISDEKIFESYKFYRLQYLSRKININRLTKSI